LYNNLDEGLEDLEDKQYKYELGGQEKKNISNNINRILKQK
jgi:hypothetical protein